jgi:hypothetical protein
LCEDTLAFQRKDNNITINLSTNKEHFMRISNVFMEGECQKFVLKMSSNSLVFDMDGSTILWMDYTHLSDKYFRSFKSFNYTTNATKNLYTVPTTRYHIIYARILQSGLLLVDCLNAVYTYVNKEELIYKNDADILDIIIMKDSPDKLEFALLDKCSIKLIGSDVKIIKFKE